MKQLLALLPRGYELHEVITAITDAAKIAEETVNDEIEVTRTTALRGKNKRIQAYISEADVILADVSSSRRDVLYELGFAHGKNKPTIIISDGPSQPTLYDLKGIGGKIIFDSSNITQSLRDQIAKRLTDAIRDPTKYNDPLKLKAQDPNAPKPTIFVSYSHKDLECLHELQKHIVPLESRGKVELWADNKIKFGTPWKTEIEHALSRSRIAILLISADFLASEFIAKNELQPLLRNARDKGTAILSVILSPCGFGRDPELSQFHPVNDPKLPLLALGPVEQAELYEKIVDHIENELAI